jgi:transposase
MFRETYPQAHRFILQILKQVARSDLPARVGFVQAQQDVFAQHQHAGFVQRNERRSGASNRRVVRVRTRREKHRGRKTGMIDCQWIQLLHSCGLLQGSFRPGDDMVRLRALQRQMSNLVQERSRYVQWMQKALDQMNVQVHRAVTDITGATGMAIVRAIVAGERDPARLAALRDRRCRKSARQIADYLTGTWREEHCFNLGSALSMFDAVEATIASYQERLQQEIDKLQPPDRRDQSPPPNPNASKKKALATRGQKEDRSKLWRFSGVDLTRIDGISVATAQAILTEVGPDLSAFRDEDAFVSWLSNRCKAELRWDRPRITPLRPATLDHRIAVLSPLSGW